LTAPQPEKCSLPPSTATASTHLPSHAPGHERWRQAAGHDHHQLAAGADAGQGELLVLPAPLQHNSSGQKTPSAVDCCMQVSTGTQGPAKEQERLRLKQMREERASKWPNTLQVRVDSAAPHAGVCARLLECVHGTHQHPLRCTMLRLNSFL
jgi:hypothetical protein